LPVVVAVTWEDFGFRVSGFGFLVSVFWFRVSGGVFRVRCSERRVSCFGSRVSCFDCPDSYFGFRASGLVFRVPGCRFRVSGFGFRVSGFVCRVPAFRFGVSGFGFRVWGFGFRVRLNLYEYEAIAEVALRPDRIYHLRANDFILRTRTNFLSLNKNETSNKDKVSLQRQLFLPTQMVVLRAHRFHSQHTHRYASNTRFNTF